MLTPLPFFVALATTIAFIYFSANRVRHLLLYLQQEEYDIGRFLQWWLSARAFDRRATSVAGIGVISSVVISSAPASTAAALLVTLSLIVLARAETNPTITGKKKLSITARAKRILLAGIAIESLLFVGLMAAISNAASVAVSVWIAGAIAIQLAPLSLSLAVASLSRHESRTQQIYYAQARSIVANTNPFTVGITGSYGKTSTKTFLADFLSADAPTFSTTRSVNTLMGVTREIRENLKPFHQWAVLECGAYQIGSIARLCRLMPPRGAIITAVGPMHLERFGTLENVYLAKSELAQALPRDGILVCNGDDAGARRIAGAFPTSRTLLYGIESSDVDCRMDRIASFEGGSKFRITWRGRDLNGSTGLFGRPMLSNLLAAFAMASSLGLDDELLVALAGDLRPPANRLQVVKNGDVTWIQDAYNSNPIGFEAALSLLASLPATRRILITPGMVELGEAQADANYQAARRAATITDVSYVVGATNRDSLLQGLHEGGASPNSIVLVRTRDEALRQVQASQRSGDLILIENDLPDLYETRVAL